MNTPTGEEGLITTRQAAALLKISHATALRWVRSGKLPARARTPGYRGTLVFELTVVQQLAEQLAQETSDGGG